MKACKTCGVNKPLSEYWKMAKSADGLQYNCKDCNRESKRQTYCTKRRKEQYMEYTYGLSKIDYELMYHRQESCCAICGIHNDDTPRGLFVDHCHATNEVRALLCLGCNTAIGHFKDNPELMEKGAQYVRRYASYHQKGGETQKREESCRET